MDCSLREASRREQSIAPKKHFLDPSGPRNSRMSLHKSSFGVPKTASFFASQRMVLLMSFQAVHFGHFLSFYTMQLELPKNAAICYLNNEGPDETNQLFRQAALNEENSMVLKLVSDACHSLHLRFNTTNSEINTPAHLLQKHEQAYVRFTTYSNNKVTKWGNKQRHQNTDLGIHRGIVTDTSCDQASIYFPGDDTTFNLRCSQKVYTIRPPVIAVPNNILGNHFLLIPSYNACPPLRDNPPPLERGPAPSLTNGIPVPGPRFTPPLPTK